MIPTGPWSFTDATGALVGPPSPVATWHRYVALYGTPTQAWRLATPDEIAAWEKP